MVLKMSYTLTIKERGREGEFEFRLKHEAVKHGVVALIIVWASTQPFS